MTALGILGEVVKIAWAVVGATCKNSPGILAKCRGHFRPTALGQHWERHAHRLRYFSGGGRGASGNAFGAWGGELMSIAGGFWQVPGGVLKEMHRFLRVSWPSLGGLSGRHPREILGG